MSTWAEHIALCRPLPLAPAPALAAAGAARRAVAARPAPPLTSLSYDPLSHRWRQVSEGSTPLTVAMPTPPPPPQPPTMASTHSRLFADKGSPPRGRRHAPVAASAPIASSAEAPAASNTAQPPPPRRNPLTGALPGDEAAAERARESAAAAAAAAARVAALPPAYRETWARSREGAVLAPSVPEPAPLHTGKRFAMRP